MTENEAIEFIEKAKEQSKNAFKKCVSRIVTSYNKTPIVFAVKREKYYSNLENCKKEIEACEVAIKALEEIQQYRAIGTVEECREAVEKYRNFPGLWDNVLFGTTVGGDTNQANCRTD